MKLCHLVLGATATVLAFGSVVATFASLSVVAATSVRLGTPNDTKPCVVLPPPARGEHETYVIDTDPCWRSMTTHFPSGTHLPGANPSKNAISQFYHGVVQLRDDFHVSGAGIDVGVWDGGLVQDNHQEFTVSGPSRVTLENRGYFASHATHVAGTIGAAGVNGVAAGMARDVRIHSYDWNHDVGEISLAPQNNISITNHSYGPRAGWDYDGGVKPSDTCSQATSEGIAPVHWRWYGNYQELEDSNFGRYDRSTPEFDKIVQANVRLSIFVSAGNQRGWNNNPSRHAFGNIYCVRVNNSWVRGSMNQVPRDDAAAGGYDTLAGFAIAKNVITIGAMRAPSTPSSTLKREDVLATEFSSFGPTDDGRIKPDVILHGVSLVSPTIPRSCEDRTTPCGPGTSQVARDAYDLMSGTSMASPVAAGIGALLNELATRRYNRPLFANEMKAVLVHTALSAHADDSPDYSVGWGAVRANFAGHLITGKEGRLTSIDVSPGALRQLSFKWVPNKLGRITAVWLDDPGIADNFGSAPNDRSRKLVKDVDLVLESPSGKKYFAWSLDPDDPAKPATNTDVNTRDNVERIDVPIQQYEPGTWRLSISSHVPLGTTIQPASVAIATYGFEP